MSKLNLATKIGVSALFWLLILTGATLFIYQAGTYTTAAAPSSTKWSELISAADLQTEVNELADRLVADTATAPSFKQNGEAVEHAAYVLAIWTNVAIDHDGTLPFKANAAAIRDKALAIAKTKTQSVAQSNAAEIKKLVHGEAGAAGDPGAALKWTDLCPLDQLMEEVNPRSNALRRAIRPATFNKLAKQASHDAAVLAALAHIAEHHTKKAEAEKKVDEWKKYAANLRNASVELSKAAADKNANVAKAAHSKVVKACNECHQEFRVEE